MTFCHTVSRFATPRHRDTQLPEHDQSPRFLHSSALGGPTSALFGLKFTPPLRVGQGGLESIGDRSRQHGRLGILVRSQDLGVLVPESLEHDTVSLGSRRPRSLGAPLGLIRSAQYGRIGDVRRLVSRLRRSACRSTRSNTVSNPCCRLATPPCYRRLE